jgi:hypothetical protein
MQVEIQLILPASLTCPVEALTKTEALAKPG